MIDPELVQASSYLSDLRIEEVTSVLEWEVPSMAALSRAPTGKGLEWTVARAVAKGWEAPRELCGAARRAPLGQCNCLKRKNVIERFRAPEGVYHCTAHYGTRTRSTSHLTTWSRSGSSRPTTTEASISLCASCGSRANPTARRSRRSRLLPRERACRRSEGRSGGGPKRRKIALAVESQSGKSAPEQSGPLYPRRLD